MVDFRKLKAGVAATVTDPVEIFRRLPKPPGINDLYTSQAEVLKEWFARRTERDIIIKLHTGGGKTLVALLIAQSAMNETRKPAVYLTPNNQLLGQVLAKASEYGIPAQNYTKGHIPTSVQAAEAVYISTYQGMFNGRSQFGVRGSTARELLDAGAIIVDDAHAAFSAVRDQFTIRVSREDGSEAFEHLAALFRTDFDAIGRLGAFDDVVSGADGFGILEVPYWAWRSRSEQVHSFLRANQSNFELAWLLLRDSFEHCHAFISSRAFVVTPLLPLVDLIPTFSDCARRVFMSATLSNDSAIVHTFDAEPTAVGKPIRSQSLAGVSERMILVPELTPAPNAVAFAKKTASAVAASKRGAVILVPSEKAAQQWTDGAEYAAGKAVDSAVAALQGRTATKPYVFPNRYDGIDLPGEACRVLVFAGLPKGASEYDLYKAAALSGGASIHSTLAQRIEQGIGRGARGPADWCLVIRKSSPHPARGPRSACGSAGLGPERERAVALEAELPVADGAVVVGVALAFALDEAVEDAGDEVVTGEGVEPLAEVGQEVVAAPLGHDECVPDDDGEFERGAARLDGRVGRQLVEDGLGVVEDGGGDLLHGRDPATAACRGQAAVAISWGSGGFSPRSAAWTARRRYALGSTPASLALSMRL